jgi:hypothetical protein
MIAMYRKKGTVITRQIAGETLLVPVRGKIAELERLYVLEGPGEFIWAQLDGIRTMEAVRDEVVRRFEVTPQEAEKDLLEFLSELKAMDLVEEAV